jgi:hypothetical protein
LEVNVSQRITGQEVQVLTVVDGQPQDTFTDIRSFEITAQLDILKEGYIGETTDRRDEIFRGVSGRMVLHIEDQSFLDFFASVVNRARRREPGTKINIKATLNFPSGQRPRVLLSDVKFGALPLNFGSRGDYGEINLEFETENFDYIKS